MAKEPDFSRKLQTIQPARPEGGAVPDRIVDAVGERHGFTSREPERIMRRKGAEPTGNLNIRPPVSTYNRFVQWAIDNRYSYPEALKELMDRAGI